MLTEAADRYRGGFRGATSSQDLKDLQQGIGYFNVWINKGVVSRQNAMKKLGRLTIKDNMAVQDQLDAV